MESHLANDPKAQQVENDAVTQAGAAIPGYIKEGEQVYDELSKGQHLSDAELAQLETDFNQAAALGAAAVKETKAGYKTTEFWLSVVLATLTLLGTFPLPPKFEAVVAAALGIAYSISRGLAKHGVPNVEGAAVTL